MRDLLNRRLWHHIQIKEVKEKDDVYQHLEFEFIGHGDKLNIFIYTYIKPESLGNHRRLMYTVIHVFFV
jgi:hypothetical protein